MVNRSYCEDCLKQIEQLREKMIETALVNGMNHPLVLKYSQELDKKHNDMLPKKVASQ
ncbi:MULTISPECIES: aspartyl-phosphate phosphatase Spo0E family protein [Bacillaceae]|uniref:aspartyl-phosphate phosphatase Spo0E family protein n=1 Tax=Bacillaceae TaxID=186817 RepID=UPI000B081565|nr:MULTISPECIES: aspartyl-phosphate phosphatase Spo0E family protein [Bacillaceae]UOE93651.1 aspartyl-phosphate phosphatase Spo0E family protein [Alkalihalobacillus sp. LMS39]